MIMIFAQNMNLKMFSHKQKKGQYFSAYCDKIERKQSDWKDKIEWFTHGTGGRKMKVVSKVIAWRPLPEPYKGE